MGRTSRYGFDESKENLGSYAWYTDNSGSKTHPVGQKKPNAWGLYDMHGNVWEWCHDWYETYSEGSVTDPPGPAVGGSNRVYRGGSWYNDASCCRASYRYRYDPGNRYVSLGCRLASQFPSSSK